MMGRVVLGGWKGVRAVLQFAARVNLCSCSCLPMLAKSVQR